MKEGRENERLTRAARVRRLVELGRVSLETDLQAARMVEEEQGGGL